MGGLSRALHDGESFHEGGDPGFAAFDVRYPDEHLVIVVLANEDDSPVREIGDAIAHRMLGD
jgi:hypothetical protein